MCKQLSDLIHQFSTWWVVLMALMVFLLFIMLLLPIQATNAEAINGDIGSPDLSFYYTAEDLYQMAEAYGEEGRKYYVRERYTFDLVWPLVYTFFLITGLSWVTRKAFAVGSLWQRSNIVPILGMLFDYLENVSTSVVMARYPAQTAVLDGLSSVFTMVKWVIVYLGIILLLIGVVASMLSWVRSKK